MNKAIARYRHWKRKHLLSLATYIIINMIIFSMIAATVILNLWALKYGTDQPLVKAMFITMAVMTALGSFVSGIISFFNYKKRFQDKNEKITEIQNHFQWYKEKKQSFYDDEENRDNNLLQNITDILNK